MCCIARRLGKGIGKSTTKVITKCRKQNFIERLINSILIKIKCLCLTNCEDLYAGTLTKRMEAI